MPVNKGWRICLGRTIELAQESGELFLLRSIQGAEDLRHASLKQRDRGFVKLCPLFGQQNVNYSAVILIALAGNQLLFLKPVHDAGKITDRHHHFGANFAKRKAAGIADGGQHVKLRWSQVDSSELILQFFMG